MQTLALVNAWSFLITAPLQEGLLSLTCWGWTFWERSPTRSLASHKQLLQTFTVMQARRFVTLNKSCCPLTT